METMSRISELQPMSQETISILERAGSRGNSTIRRPVDVRPPAERGSTVRGASQAGTSRPPARLLPAPSATCVVQGPQDPQLVHGVEHVVLRWGVHEVELQQVLHAQRLEQKHHVGQVGALDLGDGGGQQLILVRTLGVQPAAKSERRYSLAGSSLCRKPTCPPPPPLPLQAGAAQTRVLPETLTWAGPPSSARPLVGVGLADGVDLQGVHADPGVEDLEHRRGRQPGRASPPGCSPTPKQKSPS